MSFHPWLIIAAVGLGQAASWQAYGQSDTGQEGAAAEQEQSDAPTFAIPVEIIESQEAAESRARSEREAEEREKHDLIAQQGMHEATDAMNRATQDMAFFALISTITVVVGTGLLFWTLALTRQANKAAQAAVDVTREMGQTQMRAYLAPSVEKWTSRTPDLDGWAIKVNLTLENTGQSPAVGVKHRTWLGIRSDELPEDFVFAEMLLPNENDFALGPRCTSKGDMHFATKAEVVAVIAGKSFCYIAGIATYEDMFGNQHVTCHAYQLRSSPDAISGPGVEFFGWGGKANNNCT